MSEDAKEEAKEAPVEDLIRLTVKHGQNTHQVSISRSSHVKDLMDLLQGVTNVHPRGQKIIHKGKVLTASQSLVDAKVSAGAKLMLMASAGAFQGSGPSPSFRSSSPYGRHTASFSASSSPNRAFAAPPPVALAQEKERQAMWVKTGMVVLREGNLQVVPGAVWVAGPSLRTLDLGGNTLRIFPPAVSALSNLQRLCLSHNALTEMSIAWDAVAQLPHLIALALDHNQIASIPPVIGQMTSLKRLALSHNALSTLPTEVGQLKNLEWVDMAHNRLSAVPSGLSDCTNLLEANFSSNFISKVPPSLGQLTHMKVLILSNNAIKRFPSEVLKGCSEMCTLSLHGNPITIAELRQIEGWQEFDERRRAKYSKRIELQGLGSSDAFDEGADAHMFHRW